MTKRNLEQFLEDQHKHIVKTNQKIMLLKEDANKKNLEEMIRPKIDKVISFIIIEIQKDL